MVVTCRGNPACTESGVTVGFTLLSRAKDAALQPALIGTRYIARTVGYCCSPRMSGITNHFCCLAMSSAVFPVRVLHVNPFASALYVFTNRCRNKIKASSIGLHFFIAGSHRLSILDLFIH